MSTCREKLKKKDLFYLFLLIAYFGFHLYVLRNHESFRDEAQAWMIAGNTTLKELFADLCIEGHPCLWFLAVRPFAKLGMSYRLFGYIGLFVMTGAVAILLYKAPFGKLLKLLVLFSSVFCYNSPVIPRIYCLITVIILLLAQLWPSRLEKPLFYGLLIGLLFQSHIILAGFAGGLTLELFLQWLKKENRQPKIFAGICIPAVSAVCTFFELRQRPDVPKFVNTTADSLLSSISFDKNKIMESINDLERTVWGDGICELQIGPVTGKAVLLLILALLVAALIIEATAGHQWKKFFSIVLVGACGLGFSLAVRLFVYSGGYHMHVCYFLILLFLVWATYADGCSKALRGTAGVLLGAVFVLTCGVWPAAVRQDLQGPYSGSTATAEFIEQTVPEGSKIIVRENYLAPSVCAYLASDRKDLEIWSADTGEDYKIHVWGAVYSELSGEEIAQMARAQFPDAPALFYLSPEKPTDSQSFELLYAMDTPNTLEENYWFYSIKDTEE